MSNAWSPGKVVGTAVRQTPGLLFLGCIVIAAFALARSTFLFTVLWSPIVWPEALVLFAAVGFVATAIAIASILLRWRLELLLAVMTIAMVALFCGPAATAIVGFFLLSAACLATLLFYPFGGIGDIPFNLRIVIGWAAFGIIFAAIASVRIHFAAVHTLMMATPILGVAAIPMLRQAIWSRTQKIYCLSRSESTPTPLYAAGLVACIVVLSFHVALVALPERFYDAMAGHLYVSSYMAAHHAWSFDVNNYGFAFLMMAVDFLYANMFLLQGEQAARLLNFAALLFTCVAIFQIAARSCSRTTAIWTVVLFVSMPVALIESTTLFVEHTVALFIVSAVLVLVLDGFRVSLLDYALVLILLAAATASKLHGALGAVIIGVASTVLYFSERRQRSEFVKFSFITFVLASLALWPYLRAWYDTGNPFFPFLNAVFKSPYFPVANFVDTRWAGKLSPWLLYDMTFHTSRFQEASDGALGFSLFIFLAAGFAAAIYRRNMSVLFCVGVGLLIIGLLTLQLQYMRYLFIFAPLLMLGVAFAIDELGQSRFWRIPVAAVVAMVVLLNVYKLPAGAWIIGGSDLRAAFDSGARRALVLAQAPERIANQTINDVAGPTAKVLYLGNPYGALLNGTAIYNNWYNVGFSREFAKIASENDFGVLLGQTALTFVILDPDNVGEHYTIAADYLHKNAELTAQIGRLSLYRVSGVGKAPQRSERPGPAALGAEIIGFGPNPVVHARPFNQQPDGASAIWVRLNRPAGKTFVLVFGRERLVTVVSGDLLTAEVPAKLFSNPGSPQLFVEADQDGRELRSKPVTFVVH